MKTSAGAVREEQLTSHLEDLDGSYGDERLIVLTPDTDLPDGVAAVNDERVAWTSFRMISEAMPA